MASKKRIATALGGSGYAPGYGKVKAPPKPKPTAWGGGLGNSIQSSGQLAMTKFTPQTPKPQTSGGGGAAAGQGTDAGPTALPVDPTYDAQIGAYGKTRDDTIAGLEGQRTSGLLGYGYSASYDDKGNVSALAYDPNNPYSQAALARTVYQQSKTGTNNSMAAGGQLYSGALTNAQNQNDTNFNVGENGRQTSLINFLNNINAGEIGARNDYATNFANAGADRLGRAPSNPNYTPTDGGAASPAAGAGPSVNGKPIDLSKWVTTDYKSPTGKPARLYADGHREVFTDGKWKRV